MRRTRIVGAVVALGALAGLPTLPLVPAAPADAGTEVRAAMNMNIKLHDVTGESGDATGSAG